MSIKDDFKILREDVVGTNKVRFTAELEHDALYMAEAIEGRILRAIADKYVEDYGDEIIAKIDMDRLGEKINGKILGKALAQLAKDIKE